MLVSKRFQTVGPTTVRANQRRHHIRVASASDVRFGVTIKLKNDLHAIGIKINSFTCNHMVAFMQRKQMDRTFKALADDSRRKLLDILRERDGLSLGSLCEHLSMSRQAVTKHLFILESANLVITMWRGREKLHHLNARPIEEISRRWIRKYAA